MPEILLEALDERPQEILYIDDAKSVFDLAEQRGLNATHDATGQIVRIETAMRQLGLLD